MKTVTCTIFALMVSMAVNAGMVAHYDFGDGNLLDNSVDGGVGLTMTGTVTANADGFSARFSGAGANHLNADLFRDNTRSSKFTVSFWWKTDSFRQSNGDSLISSRDNSQKDDWQIEDTGSAAIRLYGRMDNTLTLAESSLSTNTWYHMVLVSDGITATWYNTQQGSALTTVGSVTKLFTLQDLRIGGNRAGNLTYDSDIASVVVYYDALGTEEINALLAAGPSAIPTQQGSALTTVGSVMKRFTLQDFCAGGKRAGLTYDSDIRQCRGLLRCPLGTEEINALPQGCRNPVRPV
jgi:hypothetical protein